MAAACLASVASATSGSGANGFVPSIPMPPRTETVAPEAEIEGLIVKAVPAGAAAWRVTVQNETNDPVSLLWDESSFVTASGDSGGRLIRGETRRIDSAKAQPPTPVPAHARASEIVLIEKLANSEQLEDDYADIDAKHGGVLPSMNKDIEDARVANRHTLRGGRIDLRIEIGGGKKTWTGRISGGKRSAPPEQPAEQQ